MALLIPALYIVLAAIALVLIYYALTSKFPENRLKLALVMYVFFLVVAIPLSYVVSSVLGDIDASGVMFVLYIAMAVIIYSVAYYKDFYKD